MSEEYGLSKNDTNSLYKGKEKSKVKFLIKSDDEKYTPKNDNKQKEKKKNKRKRNVIKQFRYI